MTDDAPRTATPVDGAALVALLLALFAVAGAFGVQPAAIFHGPRHCRRRRRAGEPPPAAGRPVAGGARAGLAAFLLGGAVMVLHLVPSTPLAFLLLIRSGDA